MLAIDMQAISDAVESALGISLTDILMELGATLVLFLVVKFFFWNKVTAYLEKRREHMDSELANAKKASEDAEALKAQTEAEVADVRRRSKEAMELAKKQSEDLRHETLRKAKEEAKLIMDSSRKEIEIEKEKVVKEMRKDVVTLAVAMAEKIIEQEVDQNKYQSIKLDEFEKSETK